MDVMTFSESRSLTPNEIMTMKTLARMLPGRWRLETERAEDGEVFAGLVAPRRDKRTFQVLLEATETGISATWWTLKPIANGAPEEVFAAIRDWLKEG